MRFAVFVCFLSLAILIVFYVGAIPNFHTDFLTNIAPEGDNSKWLPFGISGIFFALPFAIWFFLAIEELPLAAEESADPKRDIPRGTIYGLVTLVITAFLVLFLNTGMSPGASGLADSGEPLLDGLKTIFGSGTSASLLGLVAVAGLVASFHTIIYAYGRNIYSLSRAGYYPHFLSITHGKRQTPYVALILGGLIGYGLTVLLDQAGKHGWLGGNVGGALLNMAVFGAVISYAMQCFSFIRLRQTMPGIERPYRSPVGIWGAGIAAILALVSLVAMFWSSDYRAGVYGVAVFYILALIYFAFRGRHQLILSPEEEFALTRGQHGHPEDEGYGKTHVADIPTGTGGSA
jgi:ethanolamine permease